MSLRKISLSPLLVPGAEEVPGELDGDGGVVAGVLKLLELLPPGLKVLGLETLGLPLVVPPLIRDA